mmetsp:Transcript_88638/g.156458  ORF Transcript_88638/g.156458 Transcript_88638/m.156458 type:complete len:83 (+) Transcript_88638:2-250(+)
MGPSTGLSLRPSQQIFPCQEELFALGCPSTLFISLPPRAGWTLPHLGAVATNAMRPGVANCCPSGTLCSALDFTYDITQLLK